MLLSLVTAGIVVLNAAAFLLMSAGPALLEYIVASSIFSVATTLNDWIFPAAIGYDKNRIALLRLLQYITTAVAWGVMAFSHQSVIGVVFALMILVDVLVFPAYILLFQSNTALYLRIEFVKGIANSLGLIFVLALFDHDPQSYAIILLINMLVTGVAVGIAGVHRPPALRSAPLRDTKFLFGRDFWSPQLRLLLLARVIETGSLIALGRFQALSHVLSLKVAMAISSALVVNARTRSTLTLIVAHVTVYTLGTVAILVARQIGGLPIPTTLRLIQPWNAVAVLPIALAAFFVSMRSLRTGDTSIKALNDSYAETEA